MSHFETQLDKIFGLTISTYVPSFYQSSSLKAPNTLMPSLSTVLITTYISMQRPNNTSTSNKVIVIYTIKMKVRLQLSTSALNNAQSSLIHFIIEWTRMHAWPTSSITQVCSKVHESCAQEWSTHLTRPWSCSSSARPLH